MEYIECNIIEWNIYGMEFAYTIRKYGISPLHTHIYIGCSVTAASLVKLDYNFDSR